jgi:hypothetical protein
LDTLPTVPDVPPEAGPERALDPTFGVVVVLPGVAVVPAGVAVGLAAAELLPDVALTIP